MPELPEVETTRRCLFPILDRTVVGVQIRTPGFITGVASPPALLLGCRLAALERVGKQLLLAGVADRQPGTQPALGLHLGMTGSLRLVNPEDPLLQQRHTHVIWQLDSHRCIAFHDPRRFGGLWTFTDLHRARQDRFGKLGPDALLADPAWLYPKLRKTLRKLKAALLDQTVIAGLGNIYVDESLFRAGLSPARNASRVSRMQAELLCRSIREVLHEALESGGSTIRDYVNGNNDPGKFQLALRVYGRGGKPCVQCGRSLRQQTLAGRTTVHCPHCQK